MNLLDNLDPSPTADSIYYADLFRIAGRCWMIMGSGKSDAAGIASEKDRAADLARDSVALIRDGDVLHGRYDLGALPKDPARRDEVCPLHRLDVVAYCMSEQETAKAYASRPLELVEATHDLVGLLAADRPYPASMAPYCFGAARLAWLNDPVRRLARFNELTTGVVGTAFLIVPFMPTVEEKAALYKDYVSDLTRCRFRTQ